MYGTFLYPRSARSGPWVLQSDNKALISIMETRHTDKNSPWQRVLSGTSYGYIRHFNNSRNARDSVARILKNFAPEEPKLENLSNGIGWVIKTDSNPHDVPKLCAYAGLNPKQANGKATDSNLEKYSQDKEVITL